MPTRPTNWRGALLSHIGDVSGRALGKAKPKAVLVAASLTHRQCGPEGPRDAVVAVRRVDGAAPCSVQGLPLKRAGPRTPRTCPRGGSRLGRDSSDLAAFDGHIKVL